MVDEARVFRFFFFFFSSSDGGKGVNADLGRGRWAVPLGSDTLKKRESDGEKKFGGLGSGVVGGAPNM